MSGPPAALPKTSAPQSDAAGREVFLYVISVHKERKSVAAMALIECVA